MAGNPYYHSSHWLALRRQALQRDRYRCTVQGCRHTTASSRMYVDHIEGRPPVPYPTPQDRLDNLRTLCADHDNQVKERGGVRRRGGRMFVRGCDVNGNPLDPNHHWRKGAQP